MDFLFIVGIIVVVAGVVLALVPKKEKNTTPNLGGGGYVGNDRHNYDTSNPPDTKKEAVK